MADPRALARIVLAAAADADAVLAHRLASMSERERQVLERECASAIGWEAGAGD